MRGISIYNRFMRFVWVAALMVVVAVAHANPHARRAGGGRAQNLFPMPTADFKKLVDARFVIFKTRLEDRMKAAKVTEAKRDAARKHAATLQSNVMKKVDQVGVDKTITRPEAMAVRRLDVKGRLAIWHELGIPPPKRPAGGASEDD